MAREKRLSMVWNITDEDAVEQGTDWVFYHAFGGTNESGEWEFWDLTGYKALMVVRADYEDDSPILLELSTENGRIEVGHFANGWNIKLHIPASVTKRGTATANALIAMGIGVYNCVVTNPFGHETGVLKGQFAMERTTLP